MVQLQSSYRHDKFVLAPGRPGVTEAGSSTLLFPETNELKTSYTCVLQDSHSIIILQIMGKFHGILDN